MEVEAGTDNFISFVGKSFARAYFRFVYQGHAPKCPSCTMFPVCQEKYEYLRVYEVIEVRDMEHECQKNLHKEPMRVVRVHEVIPPISWAKKAAFEGSSLTFQPQICDQIECPHFQTCVPPYGIRPWDRFRINKITKEISAECRKGYNLVLCDVGKLPK